VAPSFSAKKNGAIFAITFASIKTGTSNRQRAVKRNWSITAERRGLPENAKKEGFLYYYLGNNFFLA